MKTWAMILHLLSALKFDFSQDQPQSFKVDVNKVTVLLYNELKCTKWSVQRELLSNRGERRDNGIGIIQR